MRRLYIETLTCQQVSRLALITALLTLGVGACKPGAETTEELAAPEGETEETLPEVISPDELDEATLAAMPMPDPGDAVQSCTEDAACRVYQPSDWSADVACCYEYGCGLDYVAVNQEMWALVRAWREAHAFDCVVHARENGPCNNRAITCGLSQEPPEARCLEGVCEVVFPEPWPVVVPEQQTCNMNNDCQTVTEDALSADHACCGGDDTGPPIAVNSQTVQELAAWRETLDCDQHECRSIPARSHIEQPDSQCVAGRCVLGGR